MKQTHIKHRFTSTKVRLSGLRLEPFQLHWQHCLPGLRESLPEKRPGSIFLVEHAQFFLHRFFKNVDVEGPTPPRISKAKGRKMYHLLVKQTASGNKFDLLSSNVN